MLILINILALFKISNEKEKKYFKIKVFNNLILI